MSQHSVEELEKRAEIAEARLGVAEDIESAAAKLAWGSWLIAIAVGIISYIGITHRYRREESRATDAYHRAAGLGDHYRG
jgi:hypothetical protein